MCFFTIFFDIDALIQTNISCAMLASNTYIVAFLKNSNDFVKNTKIEAVIAIIVNKIEMITINGPKRWLPK